jgi:hypothetical protein
MGRKRDNISPNATSGAERRSKRRNKSFNLVQEKSENKRVKR